MWTGASFNKGMPRSSPHTPPRLGLFGGTFDPPHWGHYLIAREAYERLALDRVIFLPCRQSPHKPGRKTTPPLARLEMTRALVRGEKWAEVSRFDLDRPGPSYSYETAEAFRSLEPKAELYWIMGSDQWDVLPTWSRPEKLAALVHFAVFPRPHAPTPRRGMRLHPLPSRHDISASQIRERVSEGKSIKGLVPDAVARYIHSRKLFVP